jgi:acetyl esterase/lipase
MKKICLKIMKAVLIACMLTGATQAAKIACVGNSITQGDWLANPAVQGYVALVQKMMGANHSVLNYGLSGRTMVRNGADASYWKESKFADLFTVKPDIITIELGTNDTKPQNWTTQANYEADYSAFIDTLRKITTANPGPHPMIMPVLPPPAAANSYAISGTIMANQVIPAILKVAAAKGCTVIDANLPFLSKMSMVFDGVHPDSNGQKVLADLFYESLQNNALGRNPKLRLLWFGSAPAATGNNSTDKPELYCFPAPDSIKTGTSVIICPGGAYGMLTMGNEGTDVAKWFASNGVTAFVLQYRLTPYHHPVELNDAKRAIRLVRYYASEWGLDTTRIGFMGFSAGGHLTSTLLTHWDTGSVTDLDPINRKTSRPGFGVLVYPVITMTGPYTHTGSRDNLLGTNPAPSAALLDSLSNQKWVRANTPPTFLAHGDADNTVPIQNSRMFDSACKAYKVLDTLVVDPGKGHGYGMNGIWPPILLSWLKAHGIIQKHVVADYYKSIPAGRDQRFAIRVFQNGIRISRDNLDQGAIAIYSINGKKLVTVPAGVTSYLFQPVSPGSYFISETGKSGKAVQVVNYLK